MPAPTTTASHPQLRTVPLLASVLLVNHFPAAVALCPFSHLTLPVILLPLLRVDPDAAGKDDFRGLRYERQEGQRRLLYVSEQVGKGRDALLGSEVFGAVGGLALLANSEHLLVEYVLHDLINVLLLHVPQNHVAVFIREVT